MHLRLITILHLKGVSFMVAMMIVCSPLLLLVFLPLKKKGKRTVVMMTLFCPLTFSGKRIYCIFLPNSRCLTNLLSQLAPKPPTCLLRPRLSYLW